MYTQEITVKNEVGLHARPATYFIQKANEFKCGIWVEKDERRVNAKSLLGVLSLGIVGGTTITLIADGSDEKEAVAALAELINSTFGEDIPTKATRPSPLRCRSPKRLCRVRRQQAAVYGRLPWISFWPEKKLALLDNI